MGTKPVGLDDLATEIKGMKGETTDDDFKALEVTAAEPIDAEEADTLLTVSYQGTHYKLLAVEVVP